MIEGWLEPGEMLPEGPFGDHTGFYTPQEPFPALTIDCVTMRKRPLLQSIVVGLPPTEDGPLGRATERFFLPLLKIIVPDIVDYHLPEVGMASTTARSSRSTRSTRSTRRRSCTPSGART